jgi:cytochrome oxidase Cu insertion factor (SCO1/SenC/PrrC family)
MRAMRLVLLLLFAMNCAVGQDRRLGPLDGQNLPPVDLERVSTGMPAPDFTLESKDGELVRLSSFKGKKNVVLVFYRGYW